MTGDARGFTLVEVMVACAVLATGILGFVEATLVAERLRGRGRALGEAVLLAEEGLERVAALGWERATAGLPLESHPELTGAAGPHPALRARAPGLEFLVLFERRGDALSPPPCTLRCYWAAPGARFRGRDVVVLRTRPR